MRLFSLILIILFPLNLVFADTEMRDLWERLKEDFDSKPFFFNENINNERNGVESPFIQSLFGETSQNNAHPLTQRQLLKLPEAEFLDFNVFKLAIQGRQRLLEAGKIKDATLLAVADFSKSSRHRRFYILDLKKEEVLINFWTSHALKSDVDGDGIPETFSNQNGSSQSSLGFMLTDQTYSGMWGYSLRLKGLDRKLNSQVLSRAVVIHGYGGLGAHDASWGNLTGSEGCLMFSLNESGRFWGLEDRSMRDIVIDTLKKGSLVFIYSDVKDESGQELIFQSDWLKKSDLKF